MKYEMIFGDQSLFRFGPQNAVSARYGKDVHGNDNYIFDSGEIKATTGQLRDTPVIAMRRIIKEPKRWTWEDKKAGWLPEVGAKCRQGHKDEIVVAVTEKFVVTECQDMSVCTTRKDVFMRSYNPIETPEEKAQRERDEWVESAYNFSTKGTYPEIDFGYLYDALLSGELPMPKKGGE